MTVQRLLPTTPTPLDDDEHDPLKEGRASTRQKYRTIAARLEKTFGTGDNPQLRRKLYIRIQLCAIEHGPQCYEIVRACVGLAQAADFPDRYFCTAITRELKSQGYWDLHSEF